MPRGTDGADCGIAWQILLSIQCIMGRTLGHSVYITHNVKQKSFNIFKNGETLNLLAVLCHSLPKSHENDNIIIAHVTRVQIQIYSFCVEQWTSLPDRLFSLLLNMTRKPTVGVTLTVFCFGRNWLLKKGFVYITYFVFFSQLL